MNQELTDVEAGFRKVRGIIDQLANIHWIIEKARESKENIDFCFINYTKILDYVDHNKLWKVLKRWDTRSPYMPPEKPVCRSRSNSYNWTWDNGQVQNWERRTSRLYTLTLLIQLICRLHHAKCRTGWHTSWNQDCCEKNQQPPICRWYHFNGW